MCVCVYRQKSGFWGFRSDKVETINGFDAKVSSSLSLSLSYSLLSLVLSLSLSLSLSHTHTHSHTLTHSCYISCIQVFSATGLDIVSRTRVEHLPDSEKSKHKAIK